MIHIRCGDDILRKLEEAGLPGEFARWADPLCQGPAPARLSGEAWTRMRAEFIADHYEAPSDNALEYLREQDRMLERAVEHDRICLWFEHDLFDQIILAFLLQWFAARGVASEKLELICIDHFDGKFWFHGLGDLDSRELRSLYDTQRRPVTRAQTELAARAWRAFTAPQPDDLARLTAQDTLPLPFLRDALIRHLQEYPSTRNGLSLTEQLTLEVMSEGFVNPEQIFREVQEKEKAPWMGDTMYWSVLRGMARGEEPLLTVQGEGHWPGFGLPQSKILARIAERGKEILAGRGDWIAANGINRWLGGVHLSGADSPWRWDPERNALVAWSSLKN